MLYLSGPGGPSDLESPEAFHNIHANFPQFLPFLSVLHFEPLWQSALKWSY